MAGIVTTTISHAAGQAVLPTQVSGQNPANQLSALQTTGTAVSQVAAQRASSEVNTDDKTRSPRVPKRTESNFQSEEQNDDREKSLREAASNEKGIGRKLNMRA